MKEKVGATSVQGMQGNRMKSVSQKASRFNHLITAEHNLNITILEKIRLFNFRPLVVYLFVPNPWFDKALFSLWRLLEKDTHKILGKKLKGCFTKWCR